MNINESLRFKGDIENCNTTDTGIYRCSSSTNAPATSDIGVLVSLKGLYGGVYMMQFYGSLVKQTLHYRFKVDATWTSWKTVQ